MAREEAVLIFRVCDGQAVSPAPFAAKLADAERHRRDVLPDELAGAANAFLVDGLHGRTLLAGFPGSPTGAATRLSPCAACCWQPDG